MMEPNELDIERSFESLHGADGVLEPHPPSRKCGCAACLPSFQDYAPGVDSHGEVKHG